MFNGLGKRKTSVARVILKPGSGKITVNDKDINEYFSQKNLIKDVYKGFVLTNTEGHFDAKIIVKGGGITGQADAIKYGIVKALVNSSPDYKKPLREAGLLTRDARVKERKKYGLKGARRAPQFSKR